MDPKTVVRRKYLTEPGETLLLTTNPATYVQRLDRFADDSGLPDERILAMPLLATPLPVASVGEDGKVAKWEGVNPLFLWHPLMWLPYSVALRLKLRTISPEDGGTDADHEIESDVIWGIRVALELTRSGLYDPATGTWLDVLAYHGIDINNEFDQDRVAAWLNGEPDSVLDSIDLTDLLGSSDADPEWALQSAIALSDVLEQAEWSLMANGIAQIMRGIDAQNTAELPAEQLNDARRELIDTWGKVAQSALHAVPADPDDGLDVVDLIGLITADIEQAETDPQASLGMLLDMLDNVAEDYKPNLEALAEVGVADVPVPAGAIAP